MRQKSTGGWGDSNRLTIDWVQMGRIGRRIFDILKSIQFACSRISLLYLGRGAFNNRPASRAARKENWSEPLQGQIGNHRFVVSVKKCLHSHGFFSKWWLVWLDMEKLLCCYILFKNL